MKAPCSDQCMANARQWYRECTGKYGLRSEALRGYRWYRNGDLLEAGECPCQSMWAALYDWDLLPVAMLT